MTQLIIGLLCCIAMMCTLKGYLIWSENKYYDGKDQSSLSTTFYKTGWRFRVLLILLVLFLFYPLLLANGFYADGTWHLYAPTALLSWGKLSLAVCMGGILGVALNADFVRKENWPHVIAATVLAAGFALVGTLLRPNWYVGAIIWASWLTYYIIKNIRNNKAGNPNAFGLYIEEVAFMSVPTCLAAYMLVNYFC